MTLNELAAKAAKRKAKIRKNAAKIMRKTKHDFSALTLTNPNYEGLYGRALNQVHMDIETDALKSIAVKHLKQMTGRDFSTLPAWELATVGKSFYVQDSGAELTVSTLDWIDGKIKYLTQKLDAIPVEVVKVEKPARKSVQAYIRENTRDILAEIDEWIDTRQLSNTLKAYIADNKIKAIDSSLIEGKYIRLLQEITHAVKKTDEQCVEAYQNFDPADMRAMQVFLATLIKDTRGFVNEKISTRKPRTKKPVTPEKKVKRMKFAEKDEATGLTSLPPTKLVGAEQAWVYNKKTRKLTVYNCADLKALDVKGSTLLNWNEKTSITKNIRKPEQLKSLVVDAGKVALRRVMDNIRAKASKPKGRIGADTLILKVM